MSRAEAAIERVLEEEPFTMGTVMRLRRLLKKAGSEAEPYKRALRDAGLAGGSACPTPEARRAAA